MSRAFLMYISVLVSSLVAMLFSGCGSDPKTAPVEVHRLDLALRGESPLDADCTNAAAELFRISGYGELNDSSLSRYASAPGIRLHERAVDSVWNARRITKLESSLGNMKARMAHIFPDMRFPGVYAIVSPFNQSVFTVDTVLYLGLNHYLGQTYEPYGYFPDYVRARKVPGRVLPDIAEALLRRDYPYQPQGDYPTALSRLLYEGALVEAEMQLSGVSEQEALGYDDGQMAWLNHNEKELWETIVGRKYLFSTDPQIALSLVNLSPFTGLFGQEVPGAVGRFIGHRIISSYLDNHAVPLSELLSPSFYESTTALADSRYRQI